MLGFPRVPVPARSPVVAPAESSRAATAAGPCANCGDASPGRYCPECGQERRTRLVSLREMAVDFLDDQLSLNSRLPRTVLFLLTRPGFLTAEYLRGRIARYIRPLRLYLAASVVFFLLLSLLDSSWLEPGAQDGAGARVAVEGDTIPLATALAGGAGEAARAPVPDGSWVDSIDVHTTVPALDRILDEKRAHFRRMTPAEAVREVMGQFREHVPTMMFLLLPVFALLLKLLYARRRRLYVEHFVFALHLHAFAFAAFTVMLLARHPTIAGTLMLWVFLYTFLAMRRVYGQGWVKTGVKYLVLGWSYGLVLTLALAVTAVVTLLLV